MISKALPTQIGMKLYSGKSSARKMSVSQEIELKHTCQAMATHSSILAWKTPCTEEPGGLQSMGSQKVRHNGVTEHFC